VVLKVSDQVPGGTRHATIVSSTNGVGIVAEREVIQGQGPSRSFQTVFGVPGAASRWIVPAGSSAGGTDTLGVVAAGRSNAEAKVTLIGAGGASTPPALASVTVTAGQRTSVDLTPYLAGRAAMVLVEAVSGQIAVENNCVLPPAYRETMMSEGTPLN
jgi:hypothetical protein